MNRRDFLKMTVTTTALAASHNIPAIGDPLDGPRRGNATTAIGRTTHPQPLVLGLGGVGTRVVQAFSTSRMGAKARILSLDDPVFSPPDEAVSYTHLRCAGVKSVKISGQSAYKSLSNPAELARRFGPLLRNTDRLFLVTGLGGRTGTLFASHFAEEAARLKVPTIALVTLPAPYEPSRLDLDLTGIRQKQLWAAEAGLKSYADAVIAIPTEAALSKMSLQAAQEESRSGLLQAMQAIFDLQFSQDGFVVEDKAIDEVLGAGDVSLTGNGTAWGQGSALDAVLLALRAPFLGYGTSRLSEQTTGAVAVIQSSGKVMLSEFREIEKTLRKTLGCETPLVVGTAIDDRAPHYAVATLILSVSAKLMDYHPFRGWRPGSG